MKQDQSLRNAAVLSVAACVAGVAILFSLRSVGIDQPLWPSINIYFRLFAQNELMPLAAVAVWSMVLFHLSTQSYPKETQTPLALKPTRAIVWATTIVVLLGTAIGGHVLLLDRGLSMDEFNAEFQARIFLKLERSAIVGAEWRPIRAAIQPVFVNWSESNHAWQSSYLPVYAGLRAIALATLGVSWIVNPVLAAASILLVARVARNSFVGNGEAPLFAVIALASSSQFLVTSMTGYSMPAHLMCSLLWLVCYQRGGVWGIVGAGLVGALALGLHNPFPHALFVAPFLVRLLRERRFSALTTLLAIYALASVVWWTWLHKSGTMTEAPTSSFRLPGVEAVIVHLMNLALLLSWQAPLVGSLMLAAILRWKSISPFEQDLAFGLMMTFSFYFLFPGTQGHGWGYRYVYACLPSIVLLAARTWCDVTSGAAPSRIRMLTLASFAAAILIGFPLRLTQATAATKSFALASAAVRSSEAKVVLVPADSIWYGRDLIRNDPFLSTGPVVIDRLAVSPPQLLELYRRFPNGVEERSVADLRQFGLEPSFRVVR